MDELNKSFPGAWYTNKKKKIIILRSQSFPCLIQLKHYFDYFVLYAQFRVHTAKGDSLNSEIPCKFRPLLILKIVPMHYFNAFSNNSIDS